MKQVVIELTPKQAGLLRFHQIQIQETIERAGVVAEGVFSAFNDIPVDANVIDVSLDPPSVTLQYVEAEKPKPKRKPRRKAGK